ncbi:hypothetical protein ACFWN1_31445 [Streptomyces sp. NPDC058459]|uniref:hypothetical protein n=1 Tax=Streptomyces sp. NPDC058459 TaxID=3346508 RepID=UPI00365816A4
MAAGAPAAAGLLTRATVPAMAVGAVRATVVGLVAGQLPRVATVGGGPKWGLRYLVGNLAVGVPAALVRGWWRGRWPLSRCG